MIRGALLCVTACAVLAVPASAAPTLAVAPPSPGCIPRSVPPQVGLTQVSRRAVDSRLLELRVRSKAMQSEQPLYVLLPKNYDASGATRYPVLYLLHGALGGYKDWVTNGVADIVGDLPAIVVMPDDSTGGSYSDWYGKVARQTGPVPSWETFHMKELVPFIDGAFPTAADRSHRFIAGLSSGGSGTMKYVAANPGLFGAAGSFSGAVDVDLDYPQYPIISEALWGVSLAPGYGPPGFCTWGDFATQRVRWQDNNPRYLAENIKGTAIFLSCGTGEPGPYDGDQAYTDPVEYEVWAMNQKFVTALDAAGIPHTDEFYGPGTHTWPYWKRELGHFLTWLGPRIGAPVPAPAVFARRSARADFSSWGWDFHAAHRAVEFTYLKDVSANGFTVTGSGALSVVTAALFAPGGSYSVRTSPGAAQTVVADGAGRLHLAVDLGPAHVIQQYTLGPQATSDWQHRRVTIAPVGA
jgi:S-formylglutathione hydrolase FrmB